MWYMLRESRRAEQRKLGKDIRTEELAKYRQGKVTIDELVPQVNVSKSQIWRDIKSGKLPAELYNATYYIKQEDADEYIRSRKK